MEETKRHRSCFPSAVNAQSGTTANVFIRGGLDAGRGKTLEGERDRGKWGERESQRERLCSGPRGE